MNSDLNSYTEAFFDNQKNDAAQPLHDPWGVKMLTLSRRFRFRFAVLLSVLSALVLFGLTPANAADLSDASVSGKVSVPAGADPTTTSIHVYLASATGDYVGTSYPNADGAYEISSLAAGSYKIQFDDYTDRSVAQWYGGSAEQDTATVVTVTAGQQLTGIDVTLAKGASISGRVSAAEGVQLTDISVSLYSAST